jgi:hypothetical protein
LRDNARVLLAEELLVLRMGPKLEGRMEDSVETGLVAAIVCELILAKRLVVEWQQHIDDEAIRVIDSRPFGDDLLDDALLLLGGGSTHAVRSWHSSRSCRTASSRAASGDASTSADT